MTITDDNLKKLKVIIKELSEFSDKLPDLTKNIINTNINFRVFLLSEWINNPEDDIPYDNYKEE